MKPLREIKLSTSAEDDLDLSNEDMFVTHDAYNRMLTDEGILVIGRKGAGKTAIRKGMKEFGRLKFDMWIDLSLRDFSAAEFNNVLGRIAKHRLNQDSLLINTWRLTIGWAMMGHALSHKLVQSRSPELGEEIRAYFERFAWPYESVDGRVLPDEVLDCVYSRFGVPSGIRDRKRYPLDDEFERIERKLHLALEAGLGAVTTVDDLDPSLEHFQEVLVPLTKALIDCAYALVHSSKARNKIRVKCFVPKDLYSSVHDRHRDKKSVDATEIRWTRESLREMLARKLHPHVKDRLKGPDRNSPGKIIATVIGETLTGYEGVESTFDAILRYSHYRPRDVLSIVNIMFGLAVEDDQNAVRISESKFLPYLEVASRRYCPNIVEEMQGRYPMLALHVKAISGLEAEFGAPQLREKIDSLYRQNGLLTAQSPAPSVIQELYDCGVIGIETWVPDLGLRRKQRIAFDYARPTTSLSEDATLYVHPLFWSSHGVVPKLRKYVEP